MKRECRKCRRRIKIMLMSTIVIIKQLNNPHHHKRTNPRVRCHDKSKCKNRQLNLLYKRNNPHHHPKIRKNLNNQTKSNNPTTITTITTHQNNSY